jgi:ribonucleotide monophosphatase NagD (HAD superfamily)
MGRKFEPIYLGKPYPAIYDYAIDEIAENFKLPAIPPRQRVLMLGDSVASDIQGRHSAGLKSGLLLTGLTSRRRRRWLAETAARTCFSSILG